uniref:Deoxyhypusine hydroxylase n=1 Tax=Setaria digitata TaxID=48799 RepID=A0A915PJ18_9BILA
MLTDSKIDEVGRLLNDSRHSLCARFRALFVLRNLGCDRSVQWIAQCFNDPSALLKHELAYCLGQTQNRSAIPVLEAVLQDEKQGRLKFRFILKVIVRHEAGEALGAIGSCSSAAVLVKYIDDEIQVIAQTCRLALQRIMWLQESKCESKEDTRKSPYNSIDPAPASAETNIDKLSSILTDASKPLWERYQALFRLRNIRTDESVKVLSKGLTCSDSALLRHEVAYALGQVQSPVAVTELKSCLENPEENHMVRHECAEALGAIATKECQELLKKFRNDPERVVRESCELALDMADYENSVKQATIIPLCARFYRKTTTNDPVALTEEDLGRLYEVSNEDIDTLYYRFMLPPKFRKQVETLNECVWLYRRSTLEATTCLKMVGVDVPNFRLVLWGRWGTGKSMTVYQTIYHVWKQGWMIFTIPNVMTIMRDYDEVKISTYREGRIDFPLLAHQILRRFKLMNTPNWGKLKECKVQKHYKWSKVEETKLGEPITNIVDIGLAAPSLSSDCVGGLLRELTHHCSVGKFPLLVTIDHANSLYGKTTMKDRNNKLVDPKYFTLIHHLRKLLRNNWTNGACLLVADKREISDARDHFTIPLETPLELFGEHIEKIEPFIPIETSLYVAEEMDTLYDYYLEKNWIVSKSVLISMLFARVSLGRTERAKKELKFLCGGNPYYYERICAFV